MSYPYGHPARPPNTYPPQGPYIRPRSDPYSNRPYGYGPSVRVYTKAETDLCLTIRDGKVTLGPSDPNDPCQEWVKDERYTEVKDEYGFPSFALVNKATGQAIKHSIGPSYPVQLIPYVPGILDESVLWTLGEDLGDGYTSMRMVNNTSLNVDAFLDSNGRAQDGTIIGLYEWLQGENQQWKIVPHEYVVPSSIQNHTHQVWDSLSQMPSVRVLTKAETNCSLAIRDSKVILARTDLSDRSQEWVKDERYTEVKDDYGFPSFALVNKATGQAIKHSIGPSYPVQLIPYVPGILDESVLWTLGEDLGDGYRSMRMVNNTSLNVDAFLDSNGRAQDGTIIGLYEWLQGENQQWKIVPHEYVVPSSIQNHTHQVWDSLSQMPSVRVLTKAETNCSLAIRDSKVILARTDLSDRSQEWVKDERYTELKDDYGFPSFALVNKATGQAIKHSIGPSYPVQLIPYVPGILDESVLWTLGEDLGDGYTSMRMVNNTSLNVDAFLDSNGRAQDGTIIGLYEWLQGENQQWKIVPHEYVVPSSIQNHTHQVWDSLSQMPSVRVLTKAETNCSLAIRDSKVILARTDLSDRSQEWVKDERYTEVKDDYGFPSFALVNKATGQAIKHSIGPSYPVQLIPYVPGILDESVLWTLGEDLGDGYRSMRMVNNTSLNVDAFLDSNGRAQDGTIIGLYEWLQGENQQWKIVPHEYVVPSSIQYHTHQVWDSLSQMPSVRVLTKAETNCSLAIRDSKVILARTDLSDRSQEWVKDERYTEVKDDYGFPSFALVNKATGQAIKHSIGPSYPVQLIPYVPGILDESVLWTLGEDLGDGYRSMRMVNNTSLNVDAFHDSNGRAQDGTIIGLYEWLQGENQQWKFVPHEYVVPSSIQNHTHQVWDSLSQMPSVRVLTKAETNCSLAIRDSKVILARTDLSDRSQEWVKDERYTEVKDDYGFPSFALVNKATGQAIKHSIGPSYPVQLIPYVPGILDESVLWTLSEDLGDGYRSMRMVNNTSLNVDAFHDSNGRAQDGTIIGLYEWLQGENQQWKIIPY